MQSITIKARRVGGELQATDDSSRWNLDVLEASGVKLTAMTQPDVQRTRRALAREGFALQVVRS